MKTLALTIVAAAASIALSSCGLPHSSNCSGCSAHGTSHAHSLSDGRCWVCGKEGCTSCPSR